MSQKKETEFVDRVRLLINYSLTNTLTENKKFIEEQTKKQPPLPELTLTEPSELPSYPREEKLGPIQAGTINPTITDVGTEYREFQDFQKNSGCVRPDKTIIPPMNAAKQSGIAALPKGMCAYPAPATCRLKYPGEYARASEATAGGDFGVVYIPPVGYKYFDKKEGLFHTVSYVEIEFFDDLDTWVKKFNTLRLSDDYIDKYLKILPMGTVSSFSITEELTKEIDKFKEARYKSIESKGRLTRNYVSRLVRGERCGYQNSTMRDEWVFDWYYAENYGPYEVPAQKLMEYPTFSMIDNRTPYEYAIDEYAPKAAWILAAVFAIGGMVTNGATWLLWLEIATEAGLGLTMAQRDFQKGQNIQGFFDLLFAVFPMLKTRTWFGKVPNEESFKVIRSMRKANLNQNSTFRDYIKWYRNADKPTQETFSKMMKRGDEWSEAKIVKEIKEEMFKKLKDNPRLLQKISWKENIHLKEFLLGLGSSALAALLVYFYGIKLNDEEKALYETIHYNLEKFNSDLAAQYSAQFIAQPEIAKKKLKENKNLVEYLDKGGLLGNAPTTVNKTKVAEKFVVEMTTDDCEKGIMNQKLNPSQIKEKEKEGYIRQKDITPEQISKVDFLSMIKINCEIYFKLSDKKPTSEKEVRKDVRTDSLGIEPKTPSFFRINSQM